MKASRELAPDTGAATPKSAATTAWTPGPWRLNGLSVSIPFGGQHHCASAHGGTAANARLIAAAPDMAEALQAQEDAERLDGEALEYIGRADAEGWDGPTAESHVNAVMRPVAAAYARARDLRLAALRKATGAE